MSNSATILSCFTIPTSSGMTDVQWVWYRRRAYVCTYTDDTKPSIGLPRWTYVNFRKPLLLSVCSVQLISTFTLRRFSSALRPRKRQLHLSRNRKVTEPF